MKIKIVSDGTVHGTYITNAETGDKIEYVKKIEWVVDADAKGDGLCRAVVTFVKVPCEMVAKRIDNEDLGGKT